MISIVVSSFKQNFYDRFCQSVAETIGDTTYEIVKINNPGLMGICEAYNVGAERAQFPYLAFCHEDIAFHTQDWGKVLTTIFENDASIGLVGCTGGTYKSYQNIGWAVDTKHTSRFMIGTHHGLSHLSKTYKGVATSYKLGPEMEIPPTFREDEIINEEVLLLDGMFLVTKKEIHQAIPFDQATFKGFHCYDLDYSLQIQKSYKVVVNHNILIEHFSEGSFDWQWYDEMVKLKQKWRHVLPLPLNKVSKRQIRSLEITSFESILRICKKNKIPILKPVKDIFKRDYIYKVGVFTWLLMTTEMLSKIIYLFIRSILNRYTKQPVASIKT